jgi:hypothetical protein
MITSMAVTAAICANTSEAALLVASFMPPSLQKFLLKAWTRLVVACRGPTNDLIYSEHPTDEYSL